MQGAIVSFGELLWDLMPSGPELGGAPANFAFRMNALGWSTALVSRVGADELGGRAVSQLRAGGLDVSRVQVDPQLPTGTVHVALNSKGEPSFEIVRNVAFDAIEWNSAIESLASGAECICFGTLVQRAETSRRTLAKLFESAPRALKVLDINLRRDCYTQDTVRWSLSQASLLKLNESEVTTLAEMLGLPSEWRAFCEAVMRQFELEACVITAGADGVYARKGREECRLPGHSVNVKDTCGAGDALTAGFIDQYLRGASLERCCEQGNALGALVAMTPGGMTPVSREELERFQNRARSSGARIG